MVSALANQPDFTLVMDLSGVILEASINSQVSDVSTADWIGQQWEDTVDDVAKARRLIQTTRQNRICGYSQINQQLPANSGSVLVEFSAVRTDDKHDRIIAIGKNLSAVVNLQKKLLSTQKEMERDFWKLRELETRYKTVVNNTSDAVFILREPDYMVIDANDQAMRVANVSQGERLENQHLPENEYNKLQALIQEAREHGRSQLRVLRFSEAKQPWMVRASSYQANSGLQYILQLSQMATVGDQHNVRPINGISCEDILTNLPGGVAILNSQNIITHANPAFAKLVGVSTTEQLLGHPLTHWIASGTDAVSEFSKNLTHKDDVTDFSVQLKGQNNTMPVVVTARLMSNVTGQFVVAQFSPPFREEAS